SEDIAKRSKELFSQVGRANFKSVDDFVANLGGLRRMRGEIITLKDEVRFIDAAAMEALEAQVKEQVDVLSQKCVEFLLQPESLDPYRERAEEQRGRVDGVTKVAEGKELEEEITTAGSDLEMLIDIVRSLSIDDTTEQTRIVEGITAIYQVVNQVKEALKNKMRSLMTAEGAAQFNAQILLLSQTATNYLDMSDSPEKCDEYFNNILNQLEDLGGDFADFPEYIEQLDQKRSELETAFEQKRLQLEEARNRKATALVSSAERMLKSIEHKLGTFEDVNDINGYMAGDRMIDSIRERVEELQVLDKAGEAEGIQSQLKSIHEEAVRQLKDKQELYVDGQNVIQFGKHKFAVNAQPLDLTMVRRGNDQNLHLTGTQYFDEVTDEAFLATREVWDQTVVSEDNEVYRAEYLAYLLWQKLEQQGIDRMTEVAEMSAEERLKVVQDFMGDRYSEAYTKGIHDQDAEKILAALLSTQSALQLARYYPRARACAAVFWNKFCDPDAAKMMLARLEGFATRNEIFPGDPTQADYVAELRAMVAAFIEETGLFPPEDADPAGEYLFYEHTNGRDWVVSQEADSLLTEFERHLVKKGRESDFTKAQKPLQKDPHSHYQLIRDWVRGFLLDRNGANKYLEEVAGLVFCGHLHKQAVVKAATGQVLEGIQGAHDAVEEGGNYPFDYLAFQEKLGRFARESVPRFEAYQELKQALIESEKEALRLHEFEPRVLSSFVRNQLVDEVYLPIVGDNLAKQIGAAGDAKRTDLMGLLLLISPPGYGKTTLMEYLANRMGLIFMKINGPALGHEVTSLDPEEAPNAGAREEVKKLNLALEMGDNVMIYVDDIQHCNPEFLQKFISLCDAQRKIEGVWRGQPKTYDMRGRRVVVVMAGNPYTESGEKFRVPDMLTNRADTYNLGDDMKGREAAFSGSYIENAITSNPALQSLGKAAQKDIQAFIR
ncbi:MAG TPA: AAA family ATPase, partial [Verrucomicrobiales bacterium]|nr:AAA family ATPase [Verrucomicrobiales bacterium]